MSNYEEKYYFKFDEVAGADADDIDALMALINDAAGSVEIDVFDTFHYLSQSEGIYFATSKNPDYATSPEAEARLKIFLKKFKNTSSKYTPIIEAFENEKIHLMDQLKTTTTPDLNTTTTNSNTNNIDMTNTTSGNGSDLSIQNGKRVTTNSGTDTTDRTFNDTPQVLGSYGGSEYNSNVAKDKVTHGLVVTDEPQNLTNSATHEEATTSTQKGSNVNIGGGSTKQTGNTTTVYDSGTPAQRLQELFTACQNIVQLWMDELRAFLIINVD